jgi:hypothetical protein
MITTSVTQQMQYTVPVVIADREVMVSQVDRKVSWLLSKLSPGNPWGERKLAAQQLGSMRNPAALHALMDVLSSDPFWMVRYAAVEALQMIGDPQAVPELLRVAERDGFQTVRSYAARVAAKLSG